jgi:hypothetical protein
MKTRSQAEKGKKVAEGELRNPLPLRDGQKPLLAEVSLNEWHKTRRLQGWEYH